MARTPNRKPQSSQKGQTRKLKLQKSTVKNLTPRSDVAENVKGGSDHCRRSR